MKRSLFLFWGSALDSRYQERGGQYSVEKAAKESELGLTPSKNRVESENPDLQRRDTDPPTLVCVIFFVRKMSRKHASVVCTRLGKIQ